MNYGGCRLFPIERRAAMIRVVDAVSTDFENIDIDPFWNVGNEREHKGHRIHAYPAKFLLLLLKKQYSMLKTVGLILTVWPTFFVDVVPLVLKPNG
jgi:hypothetical protein